MATERTQRFKEKIRLIGEAKKERYGLCEDVIRIYGGYKIIETDPRFVSLGKRITLLSGPEDCYQMRIMFPYA